MPRKRSTQSGYLIESDTAIMIRTLLNAGKPVYGLRASQEAEFRNKYLQSPNLLVNISENNDLCRYLTFVNYEMDRNIAQYQSEFPVLFQNISTCTRQQQPCHHGSSSSSAMNNNSSAVLLLSSKKSNNMEQSKASEDKQNIMKQSMATKSCKPKQSSASMGRGLSSKRNDPLLQKEGYTRENASFGLENCCTQFLPGQSHDNGDALLDYGGAALPDFGGVVKASGGDRVTTLDFGVATLAPLGNSAETAVASCISSSASGGTVNNAELTGEKEKKKNRRGKKKISQRAAQTSQACTTGSRHESDDDDKGSGIFDYNFDEILKDVAGYNSTASESYDINIPIAHECTYHYLEPTLDEINLTEELLRERLDMDPMSDEEKERDDDEYVPPTKMSKNKAPKTKKSAAMIRADVMRRMEFIDVLVKELAKKNSATAADVTVATATVATATAATACKSSRPQRNAAKKSSQVSKISFEEEYEEESLLDWSDDKPPGANKRGLNLAGNKEVGEKPSQKRIKPLEYFEYTTTEEAIAALSKFDGKLVKISNPSENLCLMAAYTNALESAEKRIAFLGGVDWCRVPTAFIRAMRRVPFEGYNIGNFLDYFKRLKRFGLVETWFCHRAEGYASLKENLFFFHVSRIWKFLQPGTVLLFCGFSIAAKYSTKYRKILLKKKDEFRKKLGDKDPYAIERQLEIFSCDEMESKGSLLFGLKSMFCDQNSPHYSPHVCAVAADAPGVIFKYDNAHSERKQIFGLEDLLPYIFNYWATYVVKFTLPEGK